MGCTASKPKPVGNFNLVSTAPFSVPEAKQTMKSNMETNTFSSSKTMQSNNMSTMSRTKQKSPVPQNNQKSGLVYLKCIFDYKARSEEDLGIMKDDILILKDDSNKDWWLCHNTRTGEEGYVPSNRVAKENSAELEDWFFGDIRRVEAETLLLNDGSKGVFLVRRGETNSNTFSLSVCDGSSEIKHYRIRVMDNGGFYVSVKICFSDMSSMINFYKNNADGLCCVLTHPPLKNTPDTVGISKNTWEAPRSYFNLIKKLGSGNFGDVWEAQFKNNLLVAVKTLKPGSMTPEAFLEEANVMKLLKHVNLVQLLAVCTEGEPLYIVTEYMKNGSLLDCLRKNITPTDIKAIIDMCLQIAQGMKYLEMKKVIHRDLAARNVLVSHDFKYKVADFGLTRVADDDIYTGTKDSKFPIKWTAVEALSHQIFTTKSDVWSYGILVYEIVTRGAHPYDRMSNLETMEFVKAGNRMNKPRDCTKELYNLMLQCWHEEPNRRPTFQNIVFFFEDYESRSGRKYLDDPNTKR